MVENVVNDCKCGWSLCLVGDSLCTFGGMSMKSAVSVPERSKGVDSSSTVFALVGSNPTADIVLDFLVLMCYASAMPGSLTPLYGQFGYPSSLSDSSIARTTLSCTMRDTFFASLLA